MTRDEAIFYIKELQKTYASMDKKVSEAVDMAIEALKIDWTPVSVGLPKEPYGCFVTVEDSFFNGYDWDDSEYLLPYFVGYDGESWNDADGKTLQLEVLAWIPAPDPYKEDKE